MDKWTPDTWLDATLVEAYEDSEDITLPAARGLIKQSGVLNADHAVDRPVVILDNGAGMAQVTDSLFAQTEGKVDRFDVTCGDIDDGLLDAIREKKASKGWSNVRVAKIDATNMVDIKNDSYDYIFGNFLYFLTSNPIAALQESLRTLRPHGTLAFTTWSLSGPFALLQLAQARLPDYPLAPPSSRLTGNWNHPRFVRDQLSQVGFSDITIKPFAFTQSAASPQEMAGKMRHVIMLHTAAWGDERREKGWELGQMIETVLREQQGEGQVKIESVVLLITAKKAGI